MTMMADFLLQPTPAGNTGRTGSRDTDTGASNRPSTGGQDFSRILVQQRQSADVRSPQPPRNPIETPRPSEVNRTDQRRDDNQVARRSEGKPAQESRQSTTDKAGSAAEQERQKGDVTTQAEPVDSDVEASVPESDDGMADIPGLLDPLLEQIKQAQAGTESPEIETEAGGLAESNEVVNNLLAMIQGSAVQAGSTLAGDKAEFVSGGNPLRGNEQMAASLNVVATGKGAVEELEFELTMDDAGGEDLPLTSQLLAATAAKPERTETLNGSVGQFVEKGVSAGEARTDALMRSEAVQSTQAARQAQGQPLNMQQPGWSKELTDKVMWMSSQNLKSAEIKLNPAELGRLDIRVQVGQENTQITFASAHAGVRDSLDGQMHRLREMLEQQGMHNVDVEVADQSQQREQHGGSSKLAGGRADEQLDEELVAVSEVEQQEQGHAGLVSYYV